MKRPQVSALPLALAVLCLLFASGCRHFAVVVTVAPDGSGSRDVELSGDPLIDSEEMTMKEFRQLYHLDDEKGWVLEKELVGEKEKLVFRLNAVAEDLSSWSGLGSDLCIEGRLDSEPGIAIGCDNKIVVESVEGSSGLSYTYRESFGCRGLKQVIVAFLANQYATRMSETFPRLSDNEIAELRGLMTGHLALYRFDLEDDEEEARQEEAMVAAVSYYSREVVLRKYPRADLLEVMGVTEALVEDQSGALDEFIQNELPGVELAAFTDVDLRVQMPGPIVETNADEIEGDTATWEFDMLHALEEPIELYVRAEVAKNRLNGLR